MQPTNTTAGHTARRKNGQLTLIKAYHVKIDAGVQGHFVNTNEYFPPSFLNAVKSSTLKAGARTAAMR